MDRKVGSSAPPTPLSDPAKAPRPMPIAFTCTRESEIETVLRLASASAVGPDVAGTGVVPSGVAGSGCAVQERIGTIAALPGPVAVVVLPGDALDPAVFELEAVTGSLDETEAGPTVPPFAAADPPTVELSALGRTSG